MTDRDALDEAMNALLRTAARYRVPVRELAAWDKDRRTRWAAAADAAITAARQAVRDAAREVYRAGSGEESFLFDDALFPEEK